MPEQISVWLSQPFSADMPAARWFLFVGFLIVTLWAWRTIMAQVSEVAGAVT
jgi:hypothetical protein